MGGCVRLLTGSSKMHAVVACNNCAQKIQMVHQNTGGVSSDEEAYGTMKTSQSNRDAGSALTE
jgi:uncharacterized protein involved in tolerance to divalent cations